MYCLFLVSFAVPFSFESVDERQAFIAELAKMAILPEISGQRNGPPLNGQWLFFCFVLFFFALTYVWKSITNLS